jgi:hypothetical protein
MMMTHLSLNTECVMGILDKVAAVVGVVVQARREARTSWLA